MADFDESLYFLDTGGAPPATGGSTGFDSNLFFLDDSPTEEPAQSPVDALSGGFGNIANALTFGFGDEILGGAAAPVALALDKIAGDGEMTLGQAYEGARDSIRSDVEGFRQENPVTSIFGSVAGGLKIPAGLLVNKATSLPVKVGALAAEGAGYGGAYGFGEGEGGVEPRLENAMAGAKTGAVVSSALGAPILGAQAALTKLAPKIQKQGQAVLRKSIGARQGDYAKTAKDLGAWDIADEQVASATRGALDDLEKAGAFGKNRKPEQMLGGLLKQETELGSRVASAIARADDAGVRAHPDFESALTYLAQGKVPADQVDRYMNMLDNLSAAIKVEGKGKLSYLQQQKIAAGSKYDPDDGPANGFWRAVYGDMQRTIEGAVPEVGPINKQLQKIIVAKPILQRNLSQEEAKTWTGWLMQNLRTSGGTLTTPTIVASLVGGAGAGPIGALTGAALALGTTPAGQRVIGKAALGLAESGASRAGSVAAKIPPAVSSGMLPQGGESESTLEGQQQSSSYQNTRPTPPATQAPTNAAANPASGLFNIAPPKILSAERRSIFGERMEPQSKHASTIAALKAPLATQESSNNPKAVGPETKYGKAKGKYQFLDTTGKEWHAKLKLSGDYDPFNEKQQEKIFEGYMGWLLDQFEGDPKLALAAYNWGIGKVKKLLSSTGATSFDQVAAKMPSETQKYVQNISGGVVGV